MDVVDVIAIIAFTTMAGFVLGASVMWRLEGRDRRAQPIWLVVSRNAMFIGFSGWSLFGQEASNGPVVTIDPGWWTALGVTAVGAFVVAFVLEIRQRLSAREPGDRWADA
jgi:protein-S-isoprenylcysteine O-methyltransferase Ste14